MAVSYPSTAFQPRTISLGLSATDRRAVEQQIEALIALLDTLDGDADAEDDELHDDPLEEGEGVSLYATMPVYGVDQRVGPVNEFEARDAYLRSMQAA